ncbi:MAG: glycosyltransferase family 9 protein [Planctomycetota bacterium]
MAQSPIVICFGALGDMVMTTPLLRALAAQHGAPCTVIGHGRWVPDLFANLPFVGAVHTIASRKRPYLISPDQWRAVRVMRQHHGHPAYLLESDRNSAALVARSGLKLTASMATTPRGINRHQIASQATLAGLTDSPAFRAVPELRVSVDEQAVCRAWLATIVPAGAPVVLMHPGNKKTAGWRRRSHNHKEWPQAAWVAVARQVLAELPSAQVLITGTAAESEMVSAIVTACTDLRVHTIAGQTPLRRLLALLTQAHSLISVDTGPAHAAAALGCPLVVLFGQTDPRVNGPTSIGPPVAVVTGPAGALVLDGESGWAAHHRMDAITADAVIVAWRNLRPT